MTDQVGPNLDEMAEEIYQSYLEKMGQVPSLQSHVDESVPKLVGTDDGKELYGLVLNKVCHEGTRRHWEDRYKN